MLRGSVILFGWGQIPFRPRRVIFRHPQAFIVANSQAVLSRGEILFRRFAIPLGGLSRVHDYAFALAITIGEITFGISIILSSRQTQPFYPFSLILRHTQAFEVAEAEIKFAVWDAMVRD